MFEKGCFTGKDVNCKKVMFVKKVHEIADENNSEDRTGKENAAK